MVCIEALLRISPSGRNMLLLDPSRCNVMLSHAAPLFRRRLVPYAARTASIGYMAIIHDRRVANDRFVDVSVMEPSAHMHDCRVVEEVATTPFSACEADTHIAKAIVHAAVIADVRSPIALMEEVCSAFKTPISRSPQIARLGSRHPCAWYPVIAVFAIGPVPGSP
jgi:hypothetical protein